MMRTIVYIDGFNLYYGAVRKTPYKWLDLRALCKHLLPPNDVQRIKYFTAKVAARPGDPDQPVRQQLYLRALATIPEIEVHYGHYLSHVVSAPLAAPPPHGPRFVNVIKTEEKGSDVNLATHLVSDAYEKRFDVAVLITNDSDLAEPVRLVTKRLGKKVGVINPHANPARALQKEATFVKTIRRGVLAASQFPVELEDATGRFRKPDKW